MENDKSRIASYAILGILISAVISGGSVYRWQNDAANKKVADLDQKITELEQTVVNLQKSNIKVNTLNNDEDIEDEVVKNDPNVELISSPPDALTEWKVYQSKNNGMEFSIEYPDTWTYQEFSCNVSGVAFCPLAGNSASNCKMTCAMNSPESPIYLYPYSGSPIIDESDSIKYWSEPNVSLNMQDDNYRKIYQEMISSFEFSK